MGTTYFTDVKITLNNGISCPGIGLDVSQIIIEDPENITLQDIIYKSIII